MIFAQKVYLDNNATTPIHKDVADAMHRVAKKCHGNPSSLYKAAHLSKSALEKSRRTIAGAINAADEEIIFTGSASEANNQIVISLFEHFFPHKKTIATSPIEHPSVLNAVEYCRTRGATVVHLPLNRSGLIDIDAFRRYIDNDTFLVCCMFANNETGSVLDINAIGEIAHAKGSLFFSDCVQALGKIPVDVKELNLDYASFSAHKINGPKGAGALYHKKGNPLSPYIHGGRQEAGLRAGTESLHNIAGFAAAADRIPLLLTRYRSIDRLKHYFVKKLTALKPDVKIRTPLESSLPNTVNVSLPGIDNAVLMAVFDYYGIAVSAGSACNTPDNKASHVLKAIGLNDKEARETIRFSMGDSTPKRGIDHTLDVINRFIKGKTPSIAIITPAFLTEAVLQDTDTYILDVRFWYDKIAIKSLSGSHEAPFFSFSGCIRRIPKDRNIIVVCQNGIYAPMIAFYLKKRGFPRVGFLMTGMDGWKTAHPELCARLCGKGISSV